MGGVAVLIVYTIAGVHMLQMYRAMRIANLSRQIEYAEFQPRLALTMVMTFIICAAIIAGYSRSYLGMQDAYSSRYLTPTLICWLASHPSPHFAADRNPPNSPLLASICANRCISGNSRCSGMFGISS